MVLLLIVEQDPMVLQLILLYTLHNSEDPVVLIWAVLLQLNYRCLCMHHHYNSSQRLPQHVVDW